MDVSKVVLFAKHIEAGMQLDEDEDVVTLSVKGSAIARWNATKVTIDEIRRAADEALGIEIARIR